MPGAMRSGCVMGRTLARRQAAVNRALHARIQREAAAARRYCEATGLPLSSSHAPALTALYEAALHHVLRYGRTSSFSYLGRRYPLERTYFGRLRVLDPETRTLMVSGGIGELW